MKTKLYVLIPALLLAAMILSACGGGDTATNNAPLNQPNVPSADPSQNSPTTNQSDPQTGDNQPSTQPLPPNENNDTEAPEGNDSEGETATVSFANDVFPILQSRCINCHGGERIEGGLVMLSYAELLAGGEDGAVIVPGDAAGSLLYELASTGEMPKRGANLTPVQLEIIMQWINSGAPDN